MRKLLLSTVIAVIPLAAHAGPSGHPTWFTLIGPQAECSLFGSEPWRFYNNLSTDPSYKDPQIGVRGGFTTLRLHDHVVVAASKDGVRHNWHFFADRGDCEQFAGTATPREFARPEGETIDRTTQASHLGASQ